MPLSSKRKTKKITAKKRINTVRTGSWQIISQARNTVTLITRAVASVATIMKDASTLNIPDNDRSAAQSALAELGRALVWTKSETGQITTLLERAEEIYSKAWAVVEKTPYVKESQLYDSVNEMYEVLHRATQPVLEPLGLLCDVLLEVDNLTEYHEAVLKSAMQTIEQVAGTAVLRKPNMAALAAI